MVLQFSDLPEEMKIEILKHLDGESVKNATLVCPEWNKIISTTPAIMKKLILKVNREDLQPNVDGTPNEKFQQLLSSKRRFFLADISDWLRNDDGEFLMVEEIREPLDTKNLDHQKMELLLHLLELEELTLHTKSVPHVLIPVTLMKLKRLKVVGSKDTFSLIRAPELEVLDARQCWQRSNLEGFENFLMASPKLETLKIWSLDSLRIISPDFPFQLRELVCEHKLLFPPSLLNDNIKKFILSQATTLEILKADCDYSKFHEIVLTRFKRLKVLETNLNALTAPAKFYRNLQPLSFLTEIKSVDGFSSETALRSILGNCPKLVKLDCVYCPILADNLEFVADHNKCLEFLGVRKIRATYTIFQRLRVLKLNEVADANQLIAFLKANPTVKTLHIHYLSEGDLNSDSLDALMKETSLQHVEILWGSHSMCTEVFNKIKNGLGTWKTLKLGIPYDNKCCLDWKPCDEFEVEFDGSYRVIIKSKQE